MSDRFDSAQTDDEKVDRWNRYLLPDPESGTDKRIPWTRATTLARTLSDEYMLNQWRNRQVVFGMGRRQDLVMLASSVEDRDEKDTLQGIADKAMEAAESSAGANVGSAWHSFAEQLDKSGELPATLPAHLRPYLDRYAEALAAANLRAVPRYVERIIGNPAVKAAGKFDRLFFPLPLGAPGTVDTQMVIGDLKTAKLESIQYAWLEIAIQLATYNHAPYIWDRISARWQAMPPTRQDFAIVMHLPQDLPPDKARVDMYRVDTEKGWDAALIAFEVRAKRSASKGWVRKLTAADLAEKIDEKPLDDVSTWAPLGAGPTLLDRVLAAMSSAELSALWREGTGTGEWTAVHTAAGMTRKAELQRDAR